MTPSKNPMDWRRARHLRDMLALASALDGETTKRGREVLYRVHLLPAPKPKRRPRAPSKPKPRGRKGKGK